MMFTLTMTMTPRPMKTVTHTCNKTSPIMIAFPSEVSMSGMRWVGNSSSALALDPKVFDGPGMLG